MSKAKKTNLLMQEVINKNNCILKRFKSKVEASIILSEYETKATNDLRTIINQSRTRAERMRIGNYLNTMINHSKVQFKNITTGIFSTPFYRDNEDFAIQADILKKSTERDRISEAKVIMNEIYKELSSKQKYKATKPIDASMPRAFSNKTLISNKKYILKELESDKTQLNKKVKLYLNSVNSLNVYSNKYMPYVNITNDIKMLHYDPKNVVPIQDSRRREDLFDMKALRKYSKATKAKNDQKVNDEELKKSFDLEVIAKIYESNRHCNIKKNYGNTINLVKQEAIDNLFYQDIMVKKSQSADQLIEMQLPDVQSYENFIKKKKRREKQLTQKKEENKTEKPSSLLSSREALKPKLQYDLKLLDDIKPVSSKRKPPFAPKDFRTKSRIISSFGDDYSRSTSMNKYLEHAAKYLGNQIYSKKQMNIKLNQFYQKVKPLPYLNKELTSSNQPSQEYFINEDKKAPFIYKSRAIDPLLTNNYNNSGKKHERAFPSEYNETTEYS